MIGQTRTLKIKVGTESSSDGLLEPTDAPQSIFFNGQDDDTVSARLTADGGLSASVGAMQISTGGLMGCNPSMGQWHNLVFKAGSNTDPHDECVQITTLLPISLTASDSGTASVIAGASTLEAEGAARTTQNEAATGLGGFLAGVVQALQKLLADLVAFVQNLF
jgi:hypothetical protein